MLKVFFTLYGVFWLIVLAAIEDPLNLISVNKRFKVSEGVVMFERALCPIELIPAFLIPTPGLAEHEITIFLEHYTLVTNINLHFFPRIGSTNKASIQLLGDDVSERLSYFAYDEGDECFIRNEVKQVADILKIRFPAKHWLDLYSFEVYGAFILGGQTRYEDQMQDLYGLRFVGYFKNYDYSIRKMVSFEYHCLSLCAYHKKNFYSFKMSDCMCLITFGKPFVPDSSFQHDGIAVMASCGFGLWGRKCHKRCNGTYGNDIALNWWQQKLDPNYNWDDEFIRFKKEEEKNLQNVTRNIMTSSSMYESRPGNQQSTMLYATRELSQSGTDKVLENMTQYVMTSEAESTRIMKNHIVSYHRKRKPSKKYDICHIIYGNTLYHCDKGYRYDTCG